VKFDGLSFRQIAVAIPILALLNWAIFQFGILPKMTEQERKAIYAGWMSTPYPYVISLAFVCAARRRHIKVDQIKAIGKESNSLESVEEGTAHSQVNVYTEYVDPKRTEWITKIQPALQKAKLKMLVAACENKLSRREIIELRAGRSKPHRRTRELIKSILEKLGFL